MDEDKDKKLPFEQQAEKLGFYDWEVAGIKHLRKWPDGFEVTQTELKKARAELLKQPIGGE